MDPMGLVDYLTSADAETATTVINKVLQARPELAPGVVNQACPELTYAPARAMTERRARGHIKSFNEKTGFGFISCPELEEVFGLDVFVHAKQLGTTIPAPGIPVTFAVVLNKDNKPQAYDVQQLDGTPLATWMPQGADVWGQKGGAWGSQAAGKGYGGGGGKGGKGGFAAAPDLSGKGGGVKRPYDATADLGRFIGRIKSINIRDATSGFGFIVSEHLQALGYPQDIYLLAPDGVGYQAGQQISFTAFMNAKGNPQAKDLALA